MRHLKNLVLFLSLLLSAVPRLAPAFFTATAPSVSVSVVGPAASALPAIAGATAILAALSDDAEAVTISALNFTAQNGDANSDIRLLWSGANLLARAEHTAIWRYNPAQQTGYYALAWHSPNTGVWDDGAYSLGTHPYPATDCVTNTISGSEGKETTGSGGSGTTHCWEIAGAGEPKDWLLPGSLAGGTGYTVVKSKWYTQVRRSHLATSGECNGLYESLYIPDYDNHPTQVVRHCQASIGSDQGAPAFYFGGSDWRNGIPSAGQNDETSSGKLRGIQLYGVALSDADIAIEAANTNSNSPQTVAGILNVWYMNQNPIPSDVTDKSSAGHNPTWANASRPAQWDSTYTASRPPSGALTMGAGR